STRAKPPAAASCSPPAPAVSPRPRTRKRKKMMIKAKRSVLASAVASVSSITKAKNYINSKGVLYLYGIIGDWWDGLDALSIVRQLEEMDGEQIEVRIQSPGGNVLEGLAMYNALKQSDKR